MHDPQRLRLSESEALKSILGRTLAEGVSADSHIFICNINPLCFSSFGTHKCPHKMAGDFCEQQRILATDITLQPNVRIQGIATIPTCEEIRLF
jgi:hypothetical protein